jgi:hypothetical protein
MNNGLEMTLLSVPFQQILSFEDSNKESVFWEHCYPCSFYRQGYCSAGFRMVTSRVRSAFSTSKCLKNPKAKVTTQPSAFLFQHGTLYNYLCLREGYTSNYLEERKSFQARVHEGVLQIRPYSLANTSGYGTVCTGSADDLLELKGEFPRIFMQHFDIGRCNTDHLIARGIGIGEWIRNFDTLFEAKIEEFAKTNTSHDFIWRHPNYWFPKGENAVTVYPPGSSAYEGYTHLFRSKHGDRTVFGLLKSTDNTLTILNPSGYHQENEHITLPEWKDRCKQ